MQYELGLLPSGQLHCFSDPTAEGPEVMAKVISTVVAAFAKNSAGDGLLLLSNNPSESELPVSFRYWKAFADQYLTQLCHLTQAEQLIGIEAPDDAAYDLMLSRRPPMKGAEYLSRAVLEALWHQFDEFVRDEVSGRFDNDLTHFLQKRAPHWHQVGRVCFHLAENSLDPDFPFAFMATYLPEIAAQGKGRHQLLGKALEEYAGENNKSRLIHLLTPVDLASKASPFIKALVDSGDIYHPLAWTAHEAYDFLQAAPLFEHCGIHVRLPDWWKKRAKARVSVTLGTNIKKTLNVSSLLQFDIQLAVGEHPLTPQEWQQLLASDDKLVYLNKQWIEVDQQKLEEALAHWQRVQGQVAHAGLSFFEGMRLLAGASAGFSGHDLDSDAQPWSTVQASKPLGTLLQQIRHPETLQEMNPGPALKAVLRPYQGVGVNWLWSLHQLGLGACLADDMGLGKTIQIISLLLLLKKEKKEKKAQTNKPSLIVLPSSLLGNWQRELSQFAPSLRVQTIHPSGISKQALERYQKQEERLSSDVVLTTYSMLLRQEWLFDHEWQLVVLDEAQAIKNPGARQTKAAKRLTAQSRIALTGTPVENRLSDLWSLFDFVCPGLLGSATRFKEYAKTLETPSRESYAPLRKLVQPYLLRRLKTDKAIISDLPDKTEVRAYCHLSKEQATLYGKTVRDLTTKLATVDGIERRGLVLSYLLRFKQICNHPAQLLGTGDYRPDKSGKLARLGEICEEISSRQEKVLVFTQFREMCDPLAEFLTGCFKQSGLVLHGEVPIKKRQPLVDHFQTEDGPPFFVLSLKAGGTGLNLTAARHVIHFDRWWNPAVENQATDRAFRIGQHHPVLVHKFVCQGTIEEKIDALIEEKTALASNLLEGGGGEKLLTELSDDELIKLVTLDLDKAMAQ